MTAWSSTRDGSRSNSSPASRKNSASGFLPTRPISARRSRFQRIWARWLLQWRSRASSVTRCSTRRRTHHRPRYELARSGWGFARPAERGAARRAVSRGARPGSTVVAFPRPRSSPRAGDEMSRFSPSMLRCARRISRRNTGLVVGSSLVDRPGTVIRRRIPYRAMIGSSTLTKNRDDPGSPCRPLRPRSC